MKFKTTIKLNRSSRRWWDFPWFWESHLEGECVGADVALTADGAMRAAHRAQRRGVRDLLARNAALSTPDPNPRPLEER